MEVDLACLDLPAVSPEVGVDKAVDPLDHLGRRGRGHRGHRGRESKTGHSLGMVLAGAVDRMDSLDLELDK